MARQDQWSFVRTAAALDGVIQECRDAGSFGLDTEFFREKTYFARLCLVQIATPERVCLIDPLDGCDPLALVPLLTDPAVEVVVHAGKQDMQLFHELSGCIPQRIFDVQHAAAFAGYGSSLPYGRLVHETLGVKLEKGEAYSDWCRRPLTDSQIRYAADDVRYLLPAADHLKNQLRNLGRLDWVEEEMQQYAESAAYSTDQEDLWRKVPGHGTLSDRQIAVLRQLALWRDETAAKRNLPRTWLIKDPALIEIARRSPSSIDALKAIRGVDAREAERSGPAIMAAIERGKLAPPIRIPHHPSRIDQARTRMLSSLADTVVRARAEQAGIAPEMVATRADVEALLLDFLSGRLQEAGHRLLAGWRRELAGEAVLELARGNIAIRPLDKPPYIEELRVKSEE